MLRGSLLLLALFALASEAVIRPKPTLSVLEGEGFLTYLEVNENFGEVQKCWFKFRDDAEVELPLDATTPISTARGEQVLPFSPSICGIRVNNVGAASAAKWTLIVQSDNGMKETGSIKLKVNPAQKKRFDTRLQRNVGFDTISCTRHEVYTQNCQIVDNQGLVSNTCSLTTLVRPNMTFECLIYNSGRLVESHEHIIVEPKVIKMITLASLENNTHNVILRCQAQTSMVSCMTQLPGGKQGFLVTEGLYNGRYSAYDSNAEKSICALEIPKPLEEAEKGLWRFVKDDSVSAPGCLFYVGEEKQVIIEREVRKLAERREKKIYASDKQISELSCLVPFVIVDCYLRDPNNTLYYPDAFQFERQRLYGKCSIRNLPVIAGIWVFGTRGPDHGEEVLQSIDVIIKPQTGELLTKQVEARRRRSVELMCKSPFGEPVEKCAFIDPQQQVHLVATKSSIKKNGHVQYFGGGLQQGECGVKIKELQSDDFGQWMCQFNIIGKSPITSTFIMEITEATVGQAHPIGLSVGIAAVLAILVAIGIGTLYYRRRNYRATHTFSSANPLEEPNSPDIRESAM